MARSENILVTELTDGYLLVCIVHVPYDVQLMHDVKLFFSKKIKLEAIFSYRIPGR